MERKVSMILIGAGIQMIPERIYIPPVENFREKNRERLYETLRNNYVENAVLLSGDVHLGQFYEAQCKSLTG